ncbi:type VI secretion system protein TssA [Halomonas pacifica]|uniref:Type VI secretion-associated protein n=1 Tax=Bisbaumannia pacifica TaxID=77098 RepID=A0A510X8Y0_9GAMM|nr:type VI secretion system protein TssA [Halomonas pacifica]MDC8804693.1 type VI secretion system protein TssA [Halomonas pacifica]GEK47863.1 type VI secretion-associated protein [Halomonas pacifica]
MRITDRSHLEPLLAPLATRPEAPPLDELADFAWLDEEMMKIGSLQHGEMDWAGAEARAARLLAEAGKDLRVLGHLLHCLQHDASPRRFTLSLELLAGSLAAWWESAAPYAGPRGARARPKLFAQFTQRAVKLAGGLRFTQAAQHDEALTALAALHDAAAARELPLGALEELQRELQRLAPGQSADQGEAAKPAGAGTAAPAAAPPPAAPEARLEAGNERGNRQALLAMADFLNDQVPDEALGYRLRRHAVWGSIQSLPAARDDGRTELAPIAADRAADYREALARGGDAALWRRIETSLALSPYWLEGHRLSAGLAERLGHPRCAEAIRDEAARFVARLPGLEALRFNDGSPFVDDDTRRWLQPAAAPAMAGGGAGGDPWQAGLEEARERLAEGDLAAALAGLDQGLAAAQAPRDAAYWRLASADLLHEAGLAALASQHYRAVQQSIAGIGLEAWEPALLARLEEALQ